MNCPLCEEICRCHVEPSTLLTGSLSPVVQEKIAPAEPMWGQPPSAVQLSAAAPPASGTEGVTAESKAGRASLDWTAEGGCPHIASPEVATSEGSSSELSADSAWRGELSARLRRYRSRRKMNPPRYPSLSLQFDSAHARHSADVASIAGPSDAAPSPRFETVSDQALALDRMEHFPTAVADEGVTTEFRSNEGANPESPEGSGAAAPGQSAKVGTSRSSRAKIIEFPHFAWGPPASPPDQLAEPVMDRPRIIEVPEVAPPPPALGGITIEAAQRQEAEKRPGVDMPLRSASLLRRILASLVDGMIVATAAALFGFIFWKIAAVRPPIVQTLGLAAGIPCLFWAVYQYLLVVYTGRTLGLRAAGLDLTFFDGTTPNRSLRRWRVLASYLSAASLGMGYAWVLLDEDSLCWHDRITHTYIAPKAAPEKSRA
jgi:hypothetical protein